MLKLLSTSRNNLENHMRLYQILLKNINLIVLITNHINCFNNRNAILHVYLEKLNKNKQYKFLQICLKK